jgi:hypothetical protein
MDTSRRFGIRSIFRVRQYDVDLHVGLAATFASGASDCAARARELQVADTTPQYILTFHAIELALKGYLAFKGYDAYQLKNKYRHGLAKMYMEAKRQGLQIHVQDVDELLRWADEHHGNGYSSMGCRRMRCCQSV